MSIALQMNHISFNRV